MFLRAALLWWLHAWGAANAVALASSGLNTPAELFAGRAALRDRPRGQYLSGEGAGAAPRIFGGFATHVGVYPFAVYLHLRVQDNIWECSGSVVHPQWVLTAAHCVKGALVQGVAFAGAVDFTTERVFNSLNIQIRMVKDHHEYVEPTPSALEHDIMMLELWRAFIQQPGFVSVIPLTPVTRYDPNFKQVCTVVGFGLRGKAEHPRTGLQRGASFLMEPGEKCRYLSINVNGLCTYDVQKKSVCDGDSGGPVMCAGEQIQFGVVMGVSYKNKCAMWCGAPARKNVHMFVGFYRDWITSFYQRGAARSGSTRARVTRLAMMICLLLLPNQAEK